MVTKSDKHEAITMGNGCIRGCITAFLAPIAGAVILSFLTYTLQAVFNPRPLHHENWGMMYIVTAPVGAVAGFMFACIYWIFFYYWQYWPKKRYMLSAFLVFTLIYCVWAYNPGDPSNPDDPSFILD